MHTKMRPIHEDQAGRGCAGCSKGPLSEPVLASSSAKSAGHQRGATGAIPSPRAAKGHVDCSIWTLVDTVVVESASKLTRKKSPKEGSWWKRALFARGLWGVGRGGAEGPHEWYQAGTKELTAFFAFSTQGRCQQLSPAPPRDADPVDHVLDVF